METATKGALSGPERYAWTVFVGFGVIGFVTGIIEFFFGINGTFADLTSLWRETAFSEVTGILLWVLVAAFGLRRGERWAWFAMSLLPLRVVAEIWGSLSYGDPGEATTA